ncbi:MAG: desulfoferrodoxin family protein, partial [Prevotella sp.]|nr:desulfoferrodoxin family protein [Prevotella sp.]
WIELITPTDVLRHELKPGDKPIAIFHTDAKEVTAREYCNLHGLWGI